MFIDGNQVPDNYFLVEVHISNNLDHIWCIDNLYTIFRGFDHNTYNILVRFYQIIFL